MITHFRVGADDRTSTHLSADPEHPLHGGVEYVGDEQCDRQDHYENQCYLGYEREPGDPELYPVPPVRRTVHDSHSSWPRV